VARLWDELPVKLPVDCRVIFYGAPALMHPTTGAVFAFAGGTHTYALRLPEAERADALRAGATRVKHYPAGHSFDLSEIGDQRIFYGRFAAKRSGVWRLSSSPRYELAGASRSCASFASLLEPPRDMRGSTAK